VLKIFTKSNIPIKPTPEGNQVHDLDKATLSLIE
jgi:hypothetical protein